MNVSSKINLLYFLSLLLLSCSSVKEMSTNKETTFEGIVTYKMSSVKPDMISQEDWNLRLKEIFGEQGYSIQNNYYKPNKFASEVNTGLEIGKQVYNPIDSLHYAWQENSDIGITENHNKQSMIRIREFIDLDTTAVINEILCKAVRVRFSIGHATIWYNSDVLKFQGKEYKGSLFENEIIERINCLPIKAEVAGMVVYEMVKFQKQKIDEDIFIIPEFREIVEKPTF